MLSPNIRPLYSHEPYTLPPCQPCSIASQTVHNLFSHHDLANETPPAALSRNSFV